MFDLITHFLEYGGYVGLAFLMLLENVFPFIPSEVIMPLAGYVAHRGDMNLFLVILSGSIGSIAGAVFYYYIGWWLGLARVHRFIGRYGRWLTISNDDIDRSHAWFIRHQQKAVLIGRLLPTVRTLISIPAGIAKMSQPRFVFLTSIGTTAFTAILAVAGHALGSQYHLVEEWMNPLTNVIVAAVVISYIYRVIVYRPRERH
ncbi:DedA family protein [Acuticoccus sp. M5D2P5]|uniref:DedA family protein n=1 Tax=Acuticoccus kalidii TaxID=2910977 RepID=UPI001F1C8585|nr:DedA family protein [Acuticoccus kalidii]MCF3934151.1 DedA family protein [Acuticoccus kalidii]